MPHREVYIIAASRTPIGSFKGSLAPFSTVELASHAVRAALEQSKVNVNDVERLTAGVVYTSNTGQAIARQIATKSGLPDTTITAHVSKVCSSGMLAIEECTMRIQLEQAEICVAVGAESMSNVPFFLQRNEIPYGGTSLVDGLKRDGLADASTGDAMGELASITASKMGITREQQDAYAANSYERALKSQKAGIFTSEITPITIQVKRGPPITVSEDEDPKKFSYEKMITLRPSFGGTNGTITAANASSLNDGACALVLCSAAYLQKHALQPLCKIVAFEQAEKLPQDFTVAPASAVAHLLTKLHLDKEKIDIWELNEAFSITPIANAMTLGLDVVKLNMNGGAVAMGHPLGMSGARIVAHAAHQLNNLSGSTQKEVYACASICNGGGGGSAILLQKVD